MNYTTIFNQYIKEVKNKSNIIVNCDVLNDKLLQRTVFVKGANLQEKFDIILEHLFSNDTVFYKCGQVLFMEKYILNGILGEIFTVQMTEIK